MDYTALHCAICCASIRHSVVDVLLVILGHILDLPARLLRVPAFARLQAVLRPAGRHTGGASLRPSSLGTCQVEYTIRV
eukprot:scaffold62895_cov78-Phaeocystis_antarctica.AAC.2